VRASWSPEPDCAIAQTAAVIGDAWSLVILRDLARGVHRFDALVAELHISRRVLTERLEHLIAHGVVQRRPYQAAPTRHDYHLTPAGRALLPVLIGMQDWGDQWLLGDGGLSATTSPRSPNARRVRELVGTVVPLLTLPSTVADESELVDGTTVVFAYPATGTPTPLPEGWAQIPGAVGCTLENRLFAAAYADFARAGVAVRGISTQRPEEQAAFAAAEGLPFPLLSDVELRVAAALRLPTLRAGDVVRLRRLVLVIDADRRVRATRYPVTDIGAAVRWSLEQSRTVSRRHRTAEEAARRAG
jgi:DNA-binding HxlR family transcriptional regulator/peroxiredoxin